MFIQPVEDQELFGPLIVFPHPSTVILRTLHVHEFSFGFFLPAVWPCLAPGPYCVHLLPS